MELAWRQQKQFVADASHELKTPLSVILTNAELLQSAQGEETRQRFSANVLTAATQMRALVSGLLDLARSDQAAYSSARERLDWSKTVLDACLPFEPVFFERGLTFLSLIHISEPTRQAEISYAVFCLKKKKQK